MFKFQDHVVVIRQKLPYDAKFEKEVRFLAIQIVSKIQKMSTMKLLTLEEARYIDLPDKEKYPNLYEKMLPLLIIKMIGFWNDSSNNYPYFPFPVENSCKLSENVKNIILGYISSRVHHISHCSGYSPCRICGKDNGTSDIRDDKYLWPSGLVHYVRDHNVALPYEFVEHILSKEKK